MLTEPEREEIEAEFAQYADKRAACIEALKVVQRHHGWVSAQHLADVAMLVGMSETELDSIATFYSLIFREPVGRHVLLLCDSVSCWLLGYERIHAQLRNQLSIDFGQTSANGVFTFLPVPCLGACDHAPVMMIDDDLHTDLAPDALASLLDRYT